MRIVVFVDIVMMGIKTERRRDEYKMALQILGGVHMYLLLFQKK